MPNSVGETSNWNSLLGTQPIILAANKASPCARELGKHEINMMLRMDVIEQGQTEWSSPILLERKNDGTLQLYVTNLQLSAITVWDSYLIRDMEEWADSLDEGPKIFTLDINMGSWRSEVAVAGRLWQDYVCIQSQNVPIYSKASWSKDAPGTVQRAVNIQLSFNEWKLAIDYFDDIFILFQSPNDHIYHSVKFWRFRKALG